MFVITADYEDADDNGVSMTQVKMLSLLIRYGADINAHQIPGSGQTPLIHCVLNGKPLLCHILLEHGGRLHAEDRSGRTAWDRIKSRGHGSLDTYIGSTIDDYK